MSDPKPVTIVYTNWKGVTKDRRVVPIHMYFGTTEYHKEDQWLLYAFDLDKDELRTFAMKDIHSWGQSLSEYVSENL